MRLFSTLAIVALAVAPVVATAQTAPAAPAPAYSSGKTTIGVLMANPATKAVVEKHVPVLAGQDTSQAASMTLKDIAQYLPNLDDKALAAIDADLAKVPAPAK